MKHICLSFSAFDCLVERSHLTIMNIIHTGILLTIISILPPFVLYIQRDTYPSLSHTVHVQAVPSEPILQASPRITTKKSNLIQSEDKNQKSTVQAATKNRTYSQPPSRPSPPQNQGSCFDYTQEYAHIHQVDMHLLNRIIRAESRGNPYARNPRSTASGCAQFLSGTWRSTRRRMGKPIVSPFDARANVETLAWTIKHQGTRPWNASRNKWKK